MVGAFGEGSQQLHGLLRNLAETKVQQKARASGEPPLDSEVGTTLAHFRRILSTTIVRAQAICLLTRIGHLGGRAREAAERRNLDVRREASLRQESRAYFQCRIRGRNSQRLSTILH